MDALFQDIRQAVRSLRRSPAFMAMAVLTLAIGIGSTTLVFRLVDKALLQPLPYAEPDRLVVVHSTRGPEEISMSFPDLRDMRDRARTLSSFAGFAGSSFNLTGRGEAERLSGQVVTVNLFETLGVSPMLGRGFLPEEEAPGGPRVAVLSHALWQRFGADANVVGTTVTLDGEPFSIIGIMPPGFDFPGGIVYGSADVWVPAGLLANEWDDRDSHPGLYGVGRLSPGVSLTDVTQELGGIAEQVAVESPHVGGRVGVVVTEALDTLVGDSRTALVLLLAAVALLLLLACVNVASLLMARATSRTREMAVRAALGAGRLRLTGQLLAEGLVLAVLGGVGGVAVSVLGARVALPLLSGLPRLDSLDFSGRVFLFVALVVGVTAVAFGLMPAISANRSDLARRLRDRIQDDGGGARSRDLLAGAQIAMAVALMIGAGTLVGGYARAYRAETGIDPSGVLTFATSLPEAEYGSSEEPVARFYRNLHTSLESLPGVQAVGGISVLPFSGGGSQSGITVPGGADHVRTDVASVTPGYFEAMGMRLLRGRGFTADDGPEVPVAVVDERFAERFFPGQDPIGKQVEGWGYHELTVVGVVAHVKNYGVTAESREELFVPHALRPANRIITVVRTDQDPASLAGAARGAVAAIDRSLPVYSLRTMREVVDGTVSAPKLAAALSTSFALVAWVLAVVGVYGITTYAVARRRREMGIRLALGASPGVIFRLVLRQALLPAAVGAGIGILGALVGSRLLASRVFGLGDTNPLLFVGLPAVLLLVVALVSSLPARRAARVEPLELVNE